jgi:hypothetical protein
MSEGIWNSRPKSDRRHFIGGSDARTIMGKDEAALLRLWRENRGEVAPEDLSTNLIVQLGNVTEDLNRRWFEANSGQDVVDVQKHVRHPVLRWMGATLERPGGGNRCRFRGEVHAAMVVLGGSGLGEICPAATAQYVGGRRPDGRPVGYYRRWQVGRDQDSRRSALPAPDHHRREKVLALRRERGTPCPVWG